MIDLHCHILTAVDDGSQTIESSIEMAKEAYREGIDKILVTPHHMDGEYINHKKEIIEKTDNFQKILYDNGINIEIRPGQEVHINGNLLDAIENDDILYTSNQGQRYLMLELPHNEVPKYTSDMIFEIKLNGIIPIIVHPERNLGIMNNPDILYDLVEQGCLTQITATSYVGGFGSKIQKFTEQIIDAKLGFMFSSDAHNLSGRRFRVEEAYTKLSKEKGKVITQAYMDNAQKVWDGKSIDVGEFNHIKNNYNLKSLMKKIFR